jgi:hypothetical protein
MNWIEVREAYERRSGLVSESILVDALYQDNAAASQQFFAHPRVIHPAKRLVRRRG